MARRTNWGEDRVFTYDRDGTVKSFPASVTDLVADDLSLAKTSSGDKRLIFQLGSADNLVS